MVLEDYLSRNAALYPDQVAVICGGERCTYRELSDKVERCASSLDVKGSLVAFRFLPSIDSLVFYFSIHRAGGVAVPLEKSIPDEKLEQVRQRMVGVNVPQDTADVLFTTGTTGQSKGVMISHKTILADAENLVEAQGYHHNLTFVINGPLNHIGSLSKVYPVLLVGGTLHIIDGMKDLNAFYEAIEQAPHKVATFLVPASIRMLLTFSASRLASCRDKVEFIETGAAPISQADMQTLCSLLPDSRLFNTYASTETGIIATYDFQHGECLAGCLGKPMRHSHIMITDDGHVACFGDTLMSGYLGDEALTRSVLRDGVIYTADLGELDASGRLRLKGRGGDVINVGGYKVQPTDVEDAALSIPYIKDCICLPAHHRVLGTVLRLLVVLDEGATFDKRQIALALRSKLEAYQVPAQYEQVASIKRTFNGKIDRKAYLTSN